MMFPTPMGKIQKALRLVAEDRRVKTGLTRAKLARMTKLSKSSVSYLLDGDREMTEKRIIQFCNVLGVTLSELESYEKENLKSAVDDLVFKLRFVLTNSQRSEYVLRSAIEGAYVEVKKSKTKT